MFVNVCSVEGVLYVEKTIYDTVDAILAGAKGVEKSIKRVSKMTKKGLKRVSKMAKKGLKRVSKMAKKGLSV